MAGLRQRAAWMTTECLLWLHMHDVSEIPEARDPDSRENNVYENVDI